MENSKTIRNRIEYVNLFAIGYRWKCPACHAIHYTHETEGFVECKTCGKKCGIGNLIIGADVDINQINS